jgi:hypothetical protein
MQLIGTEVDASGDNLAWSNVRVKIERTGDKATLARYESTVDASSEAHVPF